MNPSSEKNMPISSKREKGRIWKSNHTSLNKFERMLLQLIGSCFIAMTIQWNKTG